LIDGAEANTTNLATEIVEFSFVASAVRKSVSLMRQLRLLHLSTRA